jgi:Skp family chaperone for outer membrane proteins
MRDPLLLCCFAVVTAFGSAHSLAEDPKATPPVSLKVGLVDMKRVFEAYSGTKDADAAISEKRDQGRKELGERKEAVRKAQAEIEKLDGEIANPALGGAEKEEKTKMRQEIATAVERQERGVQEIQAAQEKELKDLTGRLRAGVVERINKVVETMVKDGKYDLVLDRSPSNAPPLTFKGGNNTDITDALISALNKKPTPSAPQAPDAPPKLAAPKDKH